MRSASAAALILALLAFHVTILPAETQNATTWSKEFAFDVADALRTEIKEGENPRKFLQYCAQLGFPPFSDIVVEALNWPRASEYAEDQICNNPKVFAEFSQRIVHFADENRKLKLFAMFASDEHLPELKKLYAEVSPYEQTQAVRSLCRIGLGEETLKFCEFISNFPPQERARGYAMMAVALNRGKPCANFPHLLANPPPYLEPALYDELFRIADENWVEEYRKPLTRCLLQFSPTPAGSHDRALEILLRRYEDVDPLPLLRSFNGLDGEIERMVISRLRKKGEILAASALLREWTDSEVDRYPFALLSEVIRADGGNFVRQGIPFGIVNRTSPTLFGEILDSAPEAAVVHTEPHLPDSHWRQWAVWLRGPNAKLSLEHYRLLFERAFGAHFISLETIEDISMLCSEKLGKEAHCLELIEKAQIELGIERRWVLELISKRLGRKLTPDDKDYFRAVFPALINPEKWRLKCIDLTPVLDKHLMLSRLAPGLFGPDLTSGSSGYLNKVLAAQVYGPLISESRLNWLIGEGSVEYSDESFLVVRTPVGVCVVRRYPEDRGRVLEILPAALQVIRFTAEKGELQIAVGGDIPVSQRFKTTPDGCVAVYSLSSEEFRDTDLDGLLDAEESAVGLPTTDADFDKDGTVDGMDPSPFGRTVGAFLLHGLAMAFGRGLGPADILERTAKKGIPPRFQKYSPLPVAVPFHQWMPNGDIDLDLPLFSFSEQKGWINFTHRFSVTKKDGKYLFAQPE
ncbi:MAG: hypothetical protein Kow00107_05120 [Planctomycetota bacterium]